MRANVFTALVILFLSISLAHAQEGPTPTVQLAPTPTIAPTVTVAPTPTTDPEILVLRAQLEQMRQTDAQMQENVQWAIGLTLGLVGALAFLVVGLNVYNTRVQYNRDKKLIHDELWIEIEVELRKQIDDSSRVLVSHVHSLIKEIETKVSLQDKKASHYASEISKLAALQSALIQVEQAPFYYGPVGDLVIDRLDYLGVIVQEVCKIEPSGGILLGNRKKISTPIGAGGEW